MWSTPVFELVKMDAEIGSYSEDGEPVREEFGRAEPKARGGVAASRNSVGEEAPRA